MPTIYYGEVCEETSYTLRTARQEYVERYGNETPRWNGSPSQQREYVGAMTEMSMFWLGAYARMRQIDDVLIVPASQNQDRNGELAHDLGIYLPRINWHKSPRTSIQAKHGLPARAKISRYNPSIVLVAFAGVEGNLHSLGSISVIHDKALPNRLPALNDKEDDKYSKDSYYRFRKIVRKWPIIRKNLIGGTPSTDKSNLSTLQQQLLKLPEALETSE